jgi:type VII secretion protein EccB
MQSQRDQVQAHLFVMNRIASGILRADPDIPVTPAGRTLRGAAAGAAISALIAIATAVYGLVAQRPTTGWAVDDTLVVVKDTGTRYLYLNGALHPVLNEASAKLLAGPRMAVDDVSSASLAGTPRGGAVGIVGAPDSLPSPGGLVTGPWLVCATRPRGTSSQLTVALESGSEAAAAQPLSQDQGLLVSVPDGAVYLLWAGERLRADVAGGALTALGYAADPPVPVPAAFLDTLPEGPELAAPEVVGRGAPGPRMGNAATRVGQLFTGPAGQHFLLLRSGLEPLTAMQYALLLGDPRTQSVAYAGSTPVAAAIGPQDLAAHLVPTPRPVLSSAQPTLPQAPPAPVAPGLDTAVCVQAAVSGLAVQYTVLTGPASRLAGRIPPLEPGDVPSCVGPARVIVPTGAGALVRGSGAAGRAEYLVADDGVKYPLASPAVAETLGYALSASRLVPAALLALLPTGPPLDPDALAAAGIVRPQPPPAQCTAVAD